MRWMCTIRRLCRGDTANVPDMLIGALGMGNNTDVLSAMVYL